MKKVWATCLEKILVFGALKIKEDDCGKDENCSILVYSV